AAPGRKSAAGRGAEINHRLVTPETLAEPGVWFLEPAKVKQAGTVSPIRPAARFAQIVNAGPEKLAADEFIVSHCQPLAESAVVLAAVNEPLRIFLVIGGVILLLIIVTDRVEHFAKTDGVRHPHRGQRRRHGSRQVELFHGCDEWPGTRDEVLRGRIFGTVVVTENGV